MSKSLGTGIDPLDTIDAHGADATRFGLLAMSSSQDVKFNEEKIQQGQELANKLWNASRLVLLSVGDGEAAARPQTVEDRWILSRLERLTERVTAQIERFELSRAALDMYGAFWGEVCDWYLELVKPRLREEPDADTSATVLFVLERCLTLLHPLMPFVTEEIWAHLPGERGLLAATEWPAVDSSLVDEEAEGVLARTIEAVTALWRYRVEVGAPAAAWIPARLVADGYDATGEQVGRLARFRFEGSANGSEPVATVPVPGGAVHVFETEDISLEEARRRRNAQREKLQQEITRLEGKLANDKFVERAPAEVVEGERQKLVGYQRELEELDA
jgi:valyl-tRNA synthetase